MINDNVGMTEHVTVELGVEAVPPNFSCSSCGKETRATHDIGWRECSVCSKRQFFGVSEEELERLVQGLKDETTRALNAESALSKANQYIKQLKEHIDARGETPPAMR